VGERKNDFIDIILFQSSSSMKAEERFSIPFWGTCPVGKEKKKGGGVGRQIIFDESSPISLSSMRRQQ
jgi:hypothetical protein